MRRAVVSQAFACLLSVLLFTPATVNPAQVKVAASIELVDVTQSAGIKFVHFKGNQGISINLEEFGPGVCVSDYDRDGWQDTYFVNARDRYDRGITVRNALYRNNGDGTFADVTDKAGVGGTESGPFHAGAVFFDYDRDGRLDLYVGSYVAFGPDARRYCYIGDVQTSCGPSAYRGSPNALYHNNGDGTFTNVTKAAYVLNPDGKNLAVGAADFDNDGWPDLFVANDGLPADLYQNLHNGKFQETAETSGMAYTMRGQTMAAMCISLGDYDNDGWLDLYISDFQKSSDHLWHNSGKGYFDEVSDQAGITVPTREVLSFGGGFVDYDNDGWLDLFIANGHVYPEIEVASPGTHYKQHNSLFHNEMNGKFVETSAAAGLTALPPRAGRGVAFADFDNDGFVDMVVSNDGDPPTLLHNSGNNGNHFVNFKLVGTKSNRDALGARIRVMAGGISQIREIMGGESYLSQSELRANFGLSKNTVVQNVEVTWPSGAHQVFHDVKADQFYLIEEGRNEIGLQKIRGRNSTDHVSAPPPSKPAP
jgi:hypothetical protein